jgi:hypothetical protein
MRRTLPSRVLAIALLIASAPLFAADPPATAKPLPAWEQLTPAQRETLIAPMRDRWNAQPDDRTRMLERAQRWQQMTPEQRQRARHGMQRWEGMNPEQREQTRALFAKMRTLDEPQRKALKAKWRAMTPEERRVWVQANPAPADMPPGPPPRD